MNKLIAGFMVLFMLLSLLSSIMDGSGGAMASTTLTQVCLENDDHIHVDSTIGFMATGGVIMIGKEKITFTALVGDNQFTGLARGIEGTKAGAYDIETAVYNEDLGVVNAALGFSTVKANVPGGWATVVLMSWDFFAITIPRVILWDYAFLQGDLLIARYILMAMSLGFVVYLAANAINTIMGVLSKLT